MNVTVDLAASQSAAMARHAGNPVPFKQLDSIGGGGIGFAREVVGLARLVSADVLLVEDVPHHIRGNNPKPAHRLQGILILAAHDAGVLDQMLFIQPDLWQRDMGVYGVGPDATRERALELGYEPPDLVARWIGRPGWRDLASNRKILRKSETDYVDAFLMGEWLAGGPDLTPSKRLQPAAL